MATACLEEGALPCLWNCPESWLWAEAMGRNHCTARKAAALGRGLRLGAQCQAGAAGKLKSLWAFPMARNHCPPRLALTGGRAGCTVQASRHS